MKKKFIYIFFGVISFHLSAQTGLDFDGDDDYVNCGDVDAFDNLTEFTIEASVYWHDLTPLSTIISKRTNHLDKIQLGLGASGYGAEIGTVDDLLFQIGDGILGRAYTTGGIISINTWFHIAVVFDGTQATNEEKLKLYVNGNQHMLTFMGTVPDAPNFQNTAPITLGNETTFSTVTNFNGILDEVRIWTTVRSQAQIQANMNNFIFSETELLLAYYTFEDGSICGNNLAITTIEDLTGNYNGILNNFNLNEGCTSNFTTGMVLNPVAVATITESGEYLDVSPAGTYLWNNGAITQSILPTANGEYWCVVTDDNGCVFDTVYYNYQSLDLLETQESFRIYPNPVCAYLTLELDLKINAIKVMDVLGSFVDVVWEEPMLDVSKLSSGLYFIEVYTDKGVFTEQFIKDE
ncbi:MAG: hypothetical protein CND86_01245 [Bacteroidetes bacterium MED-G21]|nr:MAG: hypothetical protein CND86_01245 [Bacteroidetes bacterium MED-G21]